MRPAPMRSFEASLPRIASCKAYCKNKQKSFQEACCCMTPALNVIVCAQTSQTAGLAWKIVCSSIGVSQKGSPERCCFRFLPFFSVLSVFSVFFRFSPFLPFFCRFIFRKKTGRHRSRDPFCETPIPRTCKLQLTYSGTQCTKSRGPPRKSRDLSRVAPLQRGLDRGLWPGKSKSLNQCSLGCVA